MISGPIRHDRESRGSGHDIHIVERKQPARKVVIEEIVMNSPGA